MKITEQMIMEEARKYMKPAEKIKAEAPLRAKQVRITLRNTGVEYDTGSITNHRDLADFCTRLNAEEAFEKFTIIAVDAQCRIINLYSIQGSLSEVNAYPRVIVTYALLSNAHSLFFTHNHPGGTCAPSREDIQSTVVLQKILKELGIRILDHMITTPDGKTYSMIQHGDISY